MHDAKAVDGSVEPSAMEGGLPATFQFYRFGFVRVMMEGGVAVGYYTHP
jgi:hypothetical protein